MKNAAFQMRVDNSLNNYAIVYSWHQSISMTLLLLLPVLLLVLLCVSVSCLLLILLLLWFVVGTVMQLDTGHHTAVAGWRPGCPETTPPGNRHHTPCADDSVMTAHDMA